jgi:hypothetical protein
VEQSVLEMIQLLSSCFLVDRQGRVRVVDVFRVDTLAVVCVVISVGVAFGVVMIGVVMIGV